MTGKENHISKFMYTKSVSKGVKKGRSWRSSMEEIHSLEGTKGVLKGVPIGARPPQTFEQQK